MSMRQFAELLRQVVLGLSIPVVAILLFPVMARADNALVIEETFLPVQIKGSPFRLETLVVKEAGGGRRPVAIITHGQNKDAVAREQLTARGWLRPAREFARRGYLAVVVVRRGFGRSEGKQPFDLRDCRQGFGPLISQQADDIEAAIENIKSRDDADPQNIIIVGASVGGAVVLDVSARGIPGIRAAINLSGGVRPVDSSACNIDDLLPAFAKLGETSRIPTLWLYAANDSFFAPALVRRLHEAFVAKGGQTEFHMFEPIGDDGHNLFFNREGVTHTLPALDTFLRRFRLPTYDPLPIDEAVKKLADAQWARKLVVLYHAGPTEKALAMDNTNNQIYVRFNGGDVDQIATQVVQECEAKANQPCRLIARNFEVVR
jgi:dienelactone hydrolase